MRISKSKPLYQEIIDYLIKNIQSGIYRESGRLPSEKELAEKFKVSRITSKRALVLLAENGFIKRMPGRGSFVSEHNEKNSSENETAISAYLGSENKRKMIGLVITEFSDSYGTGLLQGIEREAAKNNMNVCFRRSYSQKLEEEIINEFLELGFHGLIVMPVHGKHYNPRILRLALDHFPIVLMDRYLKGINASFVGTNNIAASQRAVHYLLELGHHNIAFLSPPPIDTSTLEDRIEGFVKGFAEKGVAVDRSIWLTDLGATIPGNFSDENLLTDISKIKVLLEQNPQISCLFAAEYAIAQVAEQAVKELGKKVPEDISILCFDGPASFTGNYDYTHIRQNELEMGRTAVILLMEQMEQKINTRAEFVESQLILGSSTQNVRVPVN